jgi:glycosyltransferase involved in cell wall biosynthesis
MSFALSVITGTLNRIGYLEKLIKQIECHKDIQLVVVDGGSTDGTIEYLERLKQPNIKPIFYNKRSSYPHFMNLCIKNSDSDYVCQFNDDALFITDFNTILESINDNDAVLFNWKIGNYEDIFSEEWISGADHSSGWCLSHNGLERGISTSCMNYGIYKKKVFEDLGLYYHRYKFYYCDGDLTTRLLNFDKKISARYDIKILVPHASKNAIFFQEDEEIYYKNIELYSKRQLPADMIFF